MTDPTPTSRAYPPTARFAGSNKSRQEVGKPGHCEACAEHGHVRAHPDLDATPAPTDRCTFNPESTCGSVMAHGNGHCCKEYDQYQREVDRAAASTPAPAQGGLTEAEREARMQAVSDEAVRVAEDVWTEDEPTLAEYELTEHILAARGGTAAAGDEGLRAAVEALRNAADDLEPLVDSSHADALNPDQWLRDRADALDATPAPTEDEKGKR